MIIYCVKCKQKTGTLELTEVLSKNNRRMVKGKCDKCGKIKSTFVPRTGIVTEEGTVMGTGLNDLISNLPFEFHQFADKGENVPGGSFNDQQKYSFCGPGTKYEQRIREGYTGINKLDQYCKLHANSTTNIPIPNLETSAMWHLLPEQMKSHRILPLMKFSEKMPDLYRE